jgi:glyoxylase-like metal-dependent hydrolase (beta-lactamase superfamily II)
MRTGRSYSTATSIMVRKFGSWDRRVPTFPNAEYLFAKNEWQHWTQGEGADSAMALAECVQPILDAGLASFVETDHRITNEISLEPSPGHTPGHVSVKIVSNGYEAFITGDAIVHPVQWAEIEWGNADVDHDLSRAIEVRRELRDRFCDTDTLIIGTHFASPTAGYVRKSEDGWWFEA